ncbi:response regulator [Erythrobacter sp. SCSIO 43205]|uniref:response regulator n=1 Tax=Erythrobacter sp. SCSIO 43205 TaxID=2779361 RepID=UPI001CA92117|nr:response regulator [Erythrobacter sp. SCSIO 43205]UAB79355.1 response regulator [Erythrobacter sp. SCSIO 43205]
MLFKESGFFGRMRFRTKLAAMTTSSAALALLLACLGLFAIQYHTEADLSEQRHRQIAKLLAENVAPAILFDDREVTRETLMSVREIEDIQSVHVIDREGATYAEFIKNPGNRAPSDTAKGEVIAVSILVDGVSLGLLEMVVTNRSLLDIVQQTLGTIVLLFSACMVLSLIIARSLRAMVFSPIDRLVQAMQELRNSGDYTMRLPTEHDPDFAMISTSFNDMLAKIEAGNVELRDKANDLREARDAAESANLAKSQFLANMSHELRTPLNAILGYSEVLRDELTLAGMKRSLEDVRWVHTSAQQLLELINGILDLSKIEAGRMDVDVHEFEVARIVRDVEKMLVPMAQRSQSEIILSLADDLGKASTDSSKLRQILLNLGSNACKFTEQGQIILAARREGRHLVFTVTDTGIGISEKDQERLFKPFSQADQSTTREYGGTGLGLAITALFADLLGGKVTLDSKPGVGSCFTVRILDDLAQKATAQNQETVEAIALPDNSDKPLALVIDDQPSACQLIVRIAEQAGYRVITAPDGEKGLAAMRANQPGVVLLDLAMPKVDGWDVLEEARCDPAIENIPVVVISVNDDENKSMQAGASDHLTKPVSPGQVSEVLQLYSGRRSGRILLAEDHEPTAELYRRGLEQMGYTVEVVANGLQGTKRLHESRYDILITDLNMSGGSGFDLINAITAMEPELRPVTFVVTGCALDAQEEAQIDQNVAKILAKNGLSPRKLAHRIAEYRTQKSGEEFEEQS